ncbi:hypothetical protein BURK1_01027 [Burkholderiales bacterium]|nr:hypothetical protein BURK1_01027 [Burkholderiales bacterium]
MTKGIVAAAIGAMLAMPAGAEAQQLPRDTAVRVKSPLLGGEWLEGRVGVAPSRCTMVFLNGKAPGGYTSMALNAVRAMQRRDGAGWVDIDVKPWLAKEPEDCREADND